MLNEPLNPKTTIVLVEKQVLEYPNMTRRLVTKEFDSAKIEKNLRRNFKRIIYPYYRRAQGGPPVTIEEINEARRALDKWLLEHYANRPDVIAAYEKDDHVPDDMREQLPDLLVPFWEILTEVNQNTKKCTYYYMDKKPPQYDQLDVFLWSGFKVLGPFTTEMKNYYKILTVSGPKWQIDPFLKEYQIG